MELADVRLKVQNGAVPMASKSTAFGEAIVCAMKAVDIREEKHVSTDQANAGALPVWWGLIQDQLDTFAREIDSLRQALSQMQARQAEAVMQKSDGPEKGKDVALIIAQVAQDQKSLKLALQTEKEERTASCAKLWDAIPGGGAGREDSMKPVTMALESERQNRNAAVASLQSQLVNMSKDTATEREEWTQQKADMRTSLFKHLAEVQELVMQERQSREHRQTSLRDQLAAEVTERKEQARQLQVSQRALEDSQTEICEQLAEERRLRLAAQSSITGHMHEVQKAFVKTDADMKASFQSLAGQLREVQATSVQSHADTKAGHAGLELKIAEECNRWSESLENLAANSREVQGQVAQACARWQAGHDELQCKIANERQFVLASSERLTKQIQPVMGTFAQTCATLEADHATLSARLAEEDKCCIALRGEMQEVNDNVSKLNAAQKQGCSELREQLSEQQGCCIALDGHVHRIQGALDRTVAEQQARHVELHGEMSNGLTLSKAVFSKELQEQLSEERRVRAAVMESLQAEMQRHVSDECASWSDSIQKTNGRVQEVQLELARACAQRDFGQQELEDHLAEECKRRAASVENLTRRLETDFHDVSSMTQAGISSVRDAVYEQRDQLDRSVDELSKLIQGERSSREDGQSELQEGLRNELARAQKELRQELRDSCVQEREQAQVLLTQARQLLCSDDEIRERFTALLRSELVSKADFLAELGRVWEAVKAERSIARPSSNAAPPASPPRMRPSSNAAPPASPPRMRSGSPAVGRAFLDPQRLRPGGSGTASGSAGPPLPKDAVVATRSTTPRATGSASASSSVPYPGAGMVRITPVTLSSGASCTPGSSISTSASGATRVLRQSSGPRAQAAWVPLRDT